MSEESFILSKRIYSSCLKNRMLCKYLEITNKYGEGLDSDLSRELEELIDFAKAYGKDIGFKNGINYSDLLWQEYINFEE